jgi:hypothetical protein
MNQRKNTVVALAVFAAGFFFALQGNERDVQPDRYLCERALEGLKVKVADNFTLGCWTAQYWGTAYFPNRFRFDPLIYQGYDVVPGFTADLGKIIGNTKLSLGGEYYYMWRNWEYDGEPSIEHSRFRGNIIVSTPFNVPVLGTCSMGVTQRFERVMQQKWSKLDQQTFLQTEGWNRVAGVANSFLRLRTTFKLSTPGYTSLKIAPYASYEGFNYLNHIQFAVDPFYYETEIGFSMSPAKGLSFSLGDQIQSTPNMRVGWEAHQISFYVFYTLDYSKQISEFTRSLIR